MGGSLSADVPVLAISFQPSEIRISYRSKPNSLNMMSLRRGENPLPASPVHGGGGSRRLTEGVNHQRSLVLNVRLVNGPILIA
jgi:hypothetical protein